MIIRTLQDKKPHLVFAREDITDGAKVLYGYLSGLESGASFEDSDLLKKFNINQPVLTKRKRELKEAGLIMQDSVGPRTYIMYVGDSSYPADVIKNMWEGIE